MLTRVAGVRKDTGLTGFSGSMSALYTPRRAVRTIGQMLTTVTAACPVEPSIGRYSATPSLLKARSHTCTSTHKSKLVFISAAFTTHHDGFCIRCRVKDQDSSVIVHRISKVPRTNLRSTVAAYQHDCLSTSLASFNDTLQLGLHNTRNTRRPTPDR